MQRKPLSNITNQLKIVVASKRKAVNSDFVAPKTLHIQPPHPVREQLATPKKRLTTPKGIIQPLHRMRVHLVTPKKAVVATASPNQGPSVLRPQHVNSPTPSIFHSTPKISTAKKAAIRCLFNPPAACTPTISPVLGNDGASNSTVKVTSPPPCKQPSNVASTSGAHANVARLSVSRPQSKITRAKVTTSRRGGQRNGGPSSSGAESSTVDDDVVSSFEVELTLQERHFKFHNTKIVMLGKSTLKFANAKEGLANLWSICQKHIKREIYFNEDRKWAWDLDVQPGAEDIDKFVTIYNTSSKVAYKPSEFFSSLKMFTRLKSATVHIYIYGKHLVKVKDFEEAKSALLKPESTDRAGAADNAALHKIAVQLKERYGRQYSALEMNWLQWANMVTRKNMDERARFLDQGPPGELLHLFRPLAFSSAEITLRNIKQGANMAMQVAGGLAFHVQGLSGSLHKLRDNFADVEMRFEGLQACLAANQTILEETCKTAAVLETPESCRIAKELVDMDDVDHREEEDYGLEEN